MTRINNSKIFEVYQSVDGRRMYTINLVPRTKVYEERVIVEDKIEYREWDPFRSKLCAAILKGCNDIKIRKNDSVLYLGSSSGTTVSHVSDIVGANGLIFAMDIAPRPLRDLVFICEKRKNIAPILADANKPQEYVDRISLVDIVYQDISQKNQVDIFKKNVDLFLKKGGFGIIAIKAKSIDIARKPMVLFKESRAELEKQFIIVDYRTLEPFQLDHCFIIVKKG